MQLSQRKRQKVKQPSKSQIDFWRAGILYFVARIFEQMHNNEYNTKEVYRLCLIVCFADFRLVFFPALNPACSVRLLPIPNL